ncbi:MAG: NAD(P)-dependent oxidoreductase [Magnetococcales bacterium]|nr:NAD(P)-dependent oxidoreductase [Magnetococcales bacterium]
MAKILITGVEGFIGLNLAQALLQSGHQVRGTDILPHRNFPSKADYYQGNLADQKFTRSLVEGVDGVIHLAGVSRASLGRVNQIACTNDNITTSVTLFQAIREENRNIWLMVGSTREVDHLHEKKKPDSLGDFYAISKVAMEHMAISFANEGCFPLMIMRMSDVYGEHNDHSDKLLPIFLDKAFAGDTLQVNNSEAVFYYTYITDVVNALLDGASTMINAPKQVEIRRLWNSNEGITIQGLAETVCRVINSTSDILLPEDNSTQLLESEQNTGTNSSQNTWNFTQEISLEDGIRALNVKRQKYPN